MPETTFTTAKLQKLRRAYAVACASKAQSFTFEGHVLLTSYAKYMIEYLEDRL